MEVTTRDLGIVTIVDLNGRLLYGPDCDAVRNHVKDLLASGKTRIVINLAGVPNVDSGGIGTLVALFTSAKNLGGEVKLVGANDKVHHSLDLTRILSVIEHCSKEDAAINAFRAKGTGTSG
jgi:anti-sigma B factor antagonist